MTTGAAAHIAEAIRASGAIVRIDPEGFADILRKADSPLVITTEGGLLGKRYEYLTSYKGFCFYTKAREPLQLPTRAETLHAGRIWIPG
jgi:hypothetical protein